MLLPAGAALLLVYFLEETDAIQQMVQEAFSIPFALPSLSAPIRHGTALLATGLKEAATLLEGERGILWLFLILLIIWFVR